MFSVLLLSVGSVVDVRHAPLLSFMTERGASIGSIELKKSRIGAGNGAFVTKDVDKDEILFTVPKSACIGLYTACGDLEVGEKLAQLAVRGQGAATAVVAGYLAKEWLSKGPEGEYGAYLAMLPWDAEWQPEGEQEQDHVLWWSESQIDSLEGSEAFEDAVGLREQVALACKVHRGLIGKPVRDAYKRNGMNMWDIWKADEDNDRAVRGAFVSILSRAFFKESSEDEENRLVPLLDLLHHSAEPNVVHRVEGDSAEDDLIVRARQPLEAGTELANCYDGGELSDAKFLSRFGFVPGCSVGEFVESIKSPGIFYSAESYGVGGGKYK